jgi:hypothetical protein
VLGWDGSVGDGAATAFAVAVERARQTLAEMEAGLRKAICRLMRRCGRSWRILRSIWPARRGRPCCRPDPVRFLGAGDRDGEAGAGSGRFAPAPARSRACRRFAVVDPRRTALAVNALAAADWNRCARPSGSGLHMKLPALGAASPVRTSARRSAISSSPGLLCRPRMGRSLPAVRRPQSGFCGKVRRPATAELGGAAVGLLDAQHRVVPWRLLSETAGAASTSGDGASADVLLARVAALEEQRKAGAAVDLAAAGFLAYEQARRLVTRGEVDEAQRLFEGAARLATAAGKELSATIARGQVAGILESRGELDEALRGPAGRASGLLGDVRSRAVTMGQIADTLESRGRVRRSIWPRRGFWPMNRPRVLSPAVRWTKRNVCSKERRGLPRRRGKNLVRPLREARSPASSKAAASLTRRCGSGRKSFRSTGRCALARGHHGADRRHPRKPRRA